MYIVSNTENCTLVRAHIALMRFTILTLLRSLSIFLPFVELGICYGNDVGQCRGTLIFTISFLFYSSFRVMLQKNH